MILDRLFTAPATTLSEEEEAALADQARAGDSEAYVALAGAYAPLLRHEDNRLRAAVPDREERRQIIACAFFEAVAAAAPGERIASVVTHTMRDETCQAVTAAQRGPVAPDRTMRKYLSVMAAANGDPKEAERLCAEAHARDGKGSLSPEAFRALRDAVVGGPSWDMLDPSKFEAAPEAEVSEAVVEIANLALSALTGKDLTVVRLAYGFEDYDPIPDAEVAHRLGINRSTAYRIRLRALDRMRAALAEHDDLDRLACLAYGIRPIQQPA